MRGLTLIPVVMLAISVASKAQPGPEQQAPSDPTAVEPAPIPEAASDPIAVSEAPPTTDSSALDSSSAKAAEAASAAAADSAARARERAQMAAQQSAKGGWRGTGPVSPVARPLVAPTVADDTAELEDERGAGRKLKSDPRASKLYRSPRKAFFYSLVLPGAGQAWCGAYGRASLFVAAELGLVYGWYHYSIREARAKGREARRYADDHWSASRYEATRKRLYDSAGSENAHYVTKASPYRDRYCDALYGYDESPGRSACLDVPDTANVNYPTHVGLLNDLDLDGSARGAQRDANVKDLATFYDRIGRDEELVTGWEDADVTDVTFQSLREWGDAQSDPTRTQSSTPWGTSQMRAVYLGMRQDADDLAATQSWFLGGLVLNHLLSALDAALVAQRSNRRLYAEERTSWVDGLHFQGGLAWTNGPSTRADMFLEF